MGKQHLAKQQQISGQQQLAKQQQQLAKQQQIAEQQYLAKQEQLAEQQRLTEQQQLHENQKLLEQQRIKEEQKLAITVEKKLVNDEHERQKEINELFDIIKPQSPKKEEARSQTSNGKGEVKFQHFHPVKQNSAPNEIKLQPAVIQSDIKFKHSKVEPIKQSNNPRRLGSFRTRQNLPDKQQKTPASRELTRQHKRLNIRQLNFDPRRRQ